MNRRQRVQYPNALYHVTSRGVRRGDRYLDDIDRQRFMDRMGETVGKFGWLVYAFELMSNHNAWQGTWGGEPIQGYRHYVESALGETCRSPFEDAAD